MRFLRFVLGLSVLAAGCADSTPEPGEPAVAPTSKFITAHDALLDQGTPNWMVAGGPGLVEMVGGTDGEPNSLTGRFALEGSAIVDAESGADRWVVVGANRTQPLDDDGLRLAEARDALSGDTIGFIEPGPTGWLIGGANGRVQLLDAQGEPTMTMIQVLGNATITTASFNGTTWLVGSAAGNVVPINQGLAPPASPDGQVLDAGAPVVAITSEPTSTSLDPPWLAFTSDSVVPVSGTGVPGAATTIVTSGNITTAEFGNGKVFVGTDDGHVGVATYGPTPTFTFTNVLGGAAVMRLVSNGTEWLALGANGQAQRLDANGSRLGAAVQISSRTDRPLVGARWTGTEWLIVVGAIGFVAFVDDQLAPPRTLTPVLGGAQINGASAGADGVLVVGAGGASQLLDALGNSVTTPATIAGGADLNAAGWNGDHWLVVGDGGAAQVVDAQGSAVGTAGTLLGGQDIHFVSWSGEFFLIGGGGGLVQVVRADGTQSAAPFEVTGATQLNDARWSGLDWLVVGTDGTAGAYARLVPTDTAADATIAAATGPLNAVDFNGIEFLVAGDGGLVQRVSGQGMLVGDPVDVLTGFDVNDIFFNGVNYIVVGDFGALRRLGQDYLPLRTPIAVLDREDAAAVLWTTPRGFPRGTCLTDELCYAGPCVGGLASGRCCDSACDRPCESCFLDDTGQPDGTCAPVVAGKQPPQKEGSAGCQRQSESTCGLTGTCDGAGECEFYGADIQCADPVCSLGRFTASATCNGMGACGAIDEQDCAPYAGCNIDGCVTSCNADQDCVDGYICTDNACVEEEQIIDPGPDPGAEDKGCCATMSGRHTGPELFLLLGIGMWLRRRR